MKQITLGKKSKPALLVALWKIEKTIDEGKMEKSKKKLDELIEMVRYSDNI
jgi:hypothetical protein